MKRRVLIAKALSHEPKILFLDEPTASVDVELRKDMWKVVNQLKNKGVTIILTTHYIEEAEVIADRVGIINQGELILVENKKELIKKMGQKKLIIDLQNKIELIPMEFDKFNLKCLVMSITSLLNWYDNGRASYSNWKKNLSGFF